MKTHKLQINTLNAITIGRTLIILATLILLPLLLLLLLPLPHQLLPLPLLAENFLTENCNKLSENPSQLESKTKTTTTTITAAATHCGLNQKQQQQEQTNSTRVAAEALIIGSDRRKASGRCIAAEMDYFNATKTADLCAPHYRARVVAAVAQAANRAKRFIIFDGAGVVKLVLGCSFPIQMVDKMRSLNYFTNIQLQYQPPPRPLYWWSLYNSSTFPLRRRQLRHATLLPRDKSRQFVYGAIEAIFERAGLAGASCLQKAICEVARLPFHGVGATGGRGIYQALLNAIFTPMLPNISTKYLNARQAGRAGADCSRTFSACSKNRNWLERISNII